MRKNDRIDYNNLKNNRMTSSMILETITPDSLRDLIRQAVREELTEQKPEALQFLTRKETAERFRISLPTLNELTRTGRINGYRVGGRVLYKEAEIDNALTQIATSKFKRK